MIQSVLVTRHLGYFLQACLQQRPLLQKRRMGFPMLVSPFPWCHAGHIVILQPKSEVIVFNSERGFEESVLRAVLESEWWVVTSPKVDFKRLSRRSVVFRPTASQIEVKKGGQR